VVDREQAHRAKNPYVQSQIVVLAQEPVPCMVTKWAAPSLQTDVLTARYDGQLDGLPGQRALL
jgi:hypothetical protein